MKVLNNIRQEVLLAFAFVIMCLLAACDPDADKPVYEEQTGVYSGTLNISLYTPDVDVEQSNVLFFENNRGCIPGALLEDEHFKNDSIYYKSCLDFNFLQNGKVDFIVSNDYTISLGFQTLDTITFALPFLEENGEVRDIFREGKFAMLYEGLKKSVSEGYVPQERFARFQQMISVITDTIVLPSLYTSVMEADCHGAALITFDHARNSYYVKYDLTPAKYQRVSNVEAALNTIESDLLSLYNAGKLSQDDIDALKRIETSIHGGEIGDGMGYCMASIANYNLSAELRLKRATGMLDELAKALYGADEYGNPRKEIWLIVNYSGTYSNKTE